MVSLLDCIHRISELLPKGLVFVALDSDSCWLNVVVVRALRIL